MAEDACASLPHDRVCCFAAKLGVDVSTLRLVGSAWADGCMPLVKTLTVTPAKLLLPGPSSGRRLQHVTSVVLPFDSITPKIPKPHRREQQDTAGDSISGASFCSVFQVLHGLRRLSALTCGLSWVRVGKAPGLAADWLSFGLQYADPWLCLQARKLPEVCGGMHVLRQLTRLELHCCHSGAAAHLQLPNLKALRLGTALISEVCMCAPSVQQLKVVQLEFGVARPYTLNPPPHHPLRP
jgi:hypothetical protein